MGAFAASGPTYPWTNPLLRARARLCLGSPESMGEMPACSWSGNLVSPISLACCAEEEAPPGA